jgi:hypothetical protein
MVSLWLIELPTAAPVALPQGAGKLLNVQPARNFFGP